MPQKITITGIPITPLRIVKSMMGKEQNATKVYSFDMQEGGSSIPAKSLPNGSDIMFTVFVNEKQLRKAGIDENNIQDRKILIQGDIVLDIDINLCPGEIGVTTNLIQLIQPKDNPREQDENI